ncbi:oligosaccharide flippase family protein [Geomonas sp. RF6]|uniref:oligosaccharide flippase family protein n=1 Tax=Geomonas sp. RF6 TaxID=2897342 RepID=UPI001E31967A|nr:oligosaccharide flippase family protein [Geomonas sp. RF6]UFS69768.1 oligosaccharide flippase family protein [Geomonas sp. RF6]
MVSSIKAVFGKEEYARLASNLFSLSTLQLVSYALPLVTLPYLVRVLGAEKFGLLMFSQSFVTYLGILVDYGFNLSATREISINRENRAKVTEIFSAVMTIKMCLLVLSFVILCATVFGFERFRHEWEVYFLSFTLVVGQALFPVWYFQGMEKMKFMTLLNIFAKVFFTVMIFVCVRREGDYLIVPLLNGLGFIISGLGSLWLVMKKMGQRFTFCAPAVLKSHLRESSEYFFSRISVSAYTSSNVFFLGLITSHTMVGYYAIAEKIYNALQQGYQPIVQSLYPYIAKQRNIRLFKKLFAYANFFNFLLVGLLFLSAARVIRIVSGHSIVESTLVLQILLAASLFVVPSIMLGYPFLAALGHKRIANYSVILGALLHIIVLSILAVLGKMTVTSVAAMVLITELIVLSIRSYGVQKSKLWNC